MKSRLLYHTRIIAIALSMVMIHACSDDDEAIEAPFYPEPSIMLETQSGEFRIGQTIRFDVEYEAAALFREFKVSLGSTVLNRIVYSSRDTGSDVYRLEVLVLDEWLGTTQTIQFELTDTQGATATASFNASISEVTPQFTIEEVQLNGTQFKQITGNINFDETLDNETLWLLNGEVQVADITTLTIEPGTSVYALTEDTELNVQIGGKLIAEGTVDEPILFSSVNAAPDQPEDPDDSDWIGVTLRGTDAPEDDSGILKYVRIEYGGNGDEALQLRQVGGATTLDYVQVFDSGDSGIRLRGGYVNMKHIVSTKPDDRGIRYSDGWLGNGQFWVVVTDVDDSAGINGRDSDDSPRNSNPTLSNITLIGPNIVGDGVGDSEGVQTRDGGNGQFYNTVVTGFENSFRNRDGAITIRNSTVFNNGDNGDDDGLHSSVRDDFREAVNNNSEEEFPLSVTYVGVSDTNASDAAVLGDFFDAVNYVGAVPEGEDWTVGWTRNFDGSLRE